jgi:ferritin-like metal-binding protein YciE
MATKQLTTKSATKKTAGKATGVSDTNGAGQQSKTLQNLLEDGLKDIYSAEMQLAEALPEMAKASYNEDLQDAFTHHLQQTKRHAERLEKVFSKLSIDKGEVETCKAMEGLIAEGKKIIEEYELSPVRDSALIIGAQKIEHYEIASYGSICELCDVLGHHATGELLGRTLNEEEETDELLTDIAQDINDEAYEMSTHEEETSEEDEEDEHEV